MLIRSICRTAGAAITALDRAVMPRCCAFCGVECEPFEDGFCHGCAEDLPWNDNPCPGCGEPQLTPLVDGLRCASCQAEPPLSTAVVAPLVYAYPIDAAIKLLKFRRRLDYLPAFGAILAGAMASLPTDIDALLPVPLHWRRQALRGFNQADELCRELHKRAGLPVVRNAQRRRNTPFQSGLDARARTANLAAAFSLHGTIDAQHPLVVDDVITTGATTRALVRALLNSGVPRVSILAVARRSVAFTGAQAGLKT